MLHRTVNTSFNIDLFVSSVVESVMYWNKLESNFCTDLHLYSSIYKEEVMWRRKRMSVATAELIGLQWVVKRMNYRIFHYWEEVGRYNAFISALFIAAVWGGNFVLSMPYWLKLFSITLFITELSYDFRRCFLKWYSPSVHFFSLFRQYF